ncbi:MAG TPA: hypothetical protein VFH36_00845 [Acidimicrobiales bacterium]|nr:hypothetical protein [Acidimicrobiales bacterium]
MASTKHRAVKWLAPVALVGVIGLAACGDDDAESARTADVGVAAVGSDRHLENQAAEAAVNARVAEAAGSDRHLENQAAEAAKRSAPADVSGSDRHLENQAAEAEAGEASLSSADAGPNVFEAGNRAAAEYEASQRQTEPTDTEEEFVPGSRHMPMR